MEKGNTNKVEKTGKRAGNKGRGDHISEKVFRAKIKSKMLKYFSGRLTFPAQGRPNLWNAEKGVSIYKYKLSIY